MTARHAKTNLTGMAFTHSKQQDSSDASLTADRVREILLVRAFEEADPEGRLLPLAARKRASKEARDSEPSGLEQIASRAERLGKLLREKFSVLELMQRAAPSATALSPVLCLVAFAIGVSLNALGPSAEINVLSFPLLFVIAWNLVVYVVLAADRFRAPSTGSRLRTPLGSLFAWISSPERAWCRLTAGFEHEKNVTDAVHRFARSWWIVGRPLHRARIERSFHAASALVALGTVLGMYVRGLALSYELTWESTFLDHEAVQALVSTVLWPADQILGLGTRLNAAGEGSPAAPWIHLYAVTAALFVIGPRLVLLMFATRRARLLEGCFHLDVARDGYYLHLLASDRGQGIHASIHSYSYSPSKLAEEGLQALLLDVFGNRARLDFKGTLEYGTEWGEHGSSAAPKGADCSVFMFNAAQSPEQEVHGHFLEGAHAALDKGDSAARVLVLVDETRYRARMGSGEDGVRRTQERQRAWSRLVKEAGFKVAFLELEGTAQAEDLERVRAAVQGASEVVAG